MSRTTWATAAVLCLASAVTACGSAGSTTLPVVTGRFGRKGDASLNVTGADTLVFVIDVLAATRG
jgi:hypothetical protein